MKNLKLSFGLGTLAIAAIIAFTASHDATANILRETSDPNSPIVNPIDCEIPTPVLCAYEFTDDNQLIGTYDGVKRQ